VGGGRYTKGFSVAGAVTAAGGVSVGGEYVICWAIVGNTGTVANGAVPIGPTGSEITDPSNLTATEEIGVALFETALIRTKYRPVVSNTLLDVFVSLRNETMR
jgi:hypothetical protein